ncbi:MAG: hypothetical protein V7K56_20325 [Nostoc sp.]
MKQQSFAEVNELDENGFEIRNGVIVEGYRDNGIRRSAIYFFLNNPLNVNSSVDYNTIDGTARAGIDYQQISGKFQLPARTTMSEYIKILTIDNNQIEFDDFLNPKSFTVKFSNPVGFGSINPDTSTFEVTDYLTTPKSNTLPDGVEGLVLENTGNINGNGNNGNNHIIGNSQNNILSGKEGNDFLEGSQGQDKLFGDGGRDGLDGGAGDDTLYGGDGPDDFLITNGFGTDKILDFKPFQLDRIILYKIPSANFEQLGESKNLRTIIKYKNEVLAIVYGVPKESVMSLTRIEPNQETYIKLNFELFGDVRTR